MRLLSGDSVRALALGLLRQVEEINVFQVGFDGLETVARRRVGIHANLVLSANQVSGNHVQLSFYPSHLVLGSDNFRPDLTVESGQSVVGRAFQQKLT